MSAVITEFQGVLDQLMDCRVPYPARTTIKISDLCSRLKLAGSKLELSFKKELDELQNEFVKICQDSGLDLEVRLQILEIIELRSFGWKPNRGMEEFYIENFHNARKVRDPSMMDSGTFDNSNQVEIEDTNIIFTAPNEKSQVEDQPEGTLGQGSNEEPDDVTRRHLMIGGSELSLESRDRRVLQLAKQHLETLFSRSTGVQLTQGGTGDKEAAGDNPPLRRPRRLEVEYVAPEISGPSLKYSREAMLTIANTRHAQVLKHKPLG